MLPNVHNFDGPMQKTHRLVHFQLEDVTQYLILWHMEPMKHPWNGFMYDKINVATFSILSSNNSVTILLSNSALTKSSKVSLQGLLPKTFVRPVNLWLKFSNSRKN